jgi:predicted permease
MDLLDVVRPVFLVIGLGFLLRLAGFLREPTNTALSKLVFYVAAPALLFRSISRTSLGESVSVPTLLLVVGVTLLVAFMVYIATARCAPSRRGVLAQGSHRSNMVFVGLPVIINAYGETAVATAAVLIAVMVVFYNLLAVLLLTLPHQQASAHDPQVWAGTALKVLRNPLILGCSGGILFAALGVDLPVSLDRSLALVGRTAAPLALLTVGAGLDFSQLRAEVPAAAGTALVKLIVYPALVYFGLRSLGFVGLDLEIPVLVMASPTAVVSYIMVREMDGDARLAGAIIIATTAASLFTILGWLVFFRLNNPV